MEEVARMNLIGQSLILVVCGLAVFGLAIFASVWLLDRILDLF